MGKAESRIADLGLVLPEPLVVPAGAEYPFPAVNIVGNRVLISGHGPQAPDGTIAGPFGKVGADVDEDTAQALARMTGLGILSSLKRALGDLDRIERWVRVFGMVNSAPGFSRQPYVINGFTFLIHDVFGPEIGAHARSAVGMASLPEGIAVEIEAEVLIRP